jgi:hypothetical protein
MARIGTSGTGGASNGSGSGNVSGIPPTTIDAIARWADTTGTTIQNSPGTLIQDSGAIEAQAFLADKQILNLVTVPAHYTMLQTEIFLISGDVVLDGDATLLLL